MKKVIVLLTIGLTLLSCNLLKKAKNSGVNMYTIEQDKELGAQVAAEIAANPNEYPIVDSAANAELYAYVYKIRNKILNSGKVTNKDKFTWRVQIVNSDSVLNAFCTPGGYIYVYTGLMKYLDTEDELAGVIGHEIAHADLRHSTRQMTTMYGVEALAGAITGNRENLKKITAGVIGLKFSRDHENEADAKSVAYLCPTDYNANGGGKFFEKMVAAGNTKTIEFLSTHPNSEDRIKNYKEQKTALGCLGNKDFRAEYTAMKKLLTNIKTAGSGPVFNTGTIRR